MSLLSGNYPAAQRLSKNGQEGLTAVQVWPNYFLNTLQQLAGQAPMVAPANVTWYRLDPPADAPRACTATATSTCVPSAASICRSLNIRTLQRASNQWCDIA